MRSKFKLAQGQVWQQGDAFFRIVKWSRLTIDYKALKDLASKEGSLHAVSKKEFCRLIKGATLLSAEQVAALQAAPAADGLAAVPCAEAENARGAGDSPGAGGEADDEQHGG